MIDIIKADKIGRFIMLKTPLTMFSIILFIFGKPSEAWSGSEVGTNSEQRARNSGIEWWNSFRPASWRRLSLPRPTLCQCNKHCGLDDRSDALPAHACENGAINASKSSNSTSTSTWVETEPTFRSALRSMPHCFV
jgi:hypothetical protein